MVQHYNGLGLLNVLANERIVDAGLSPAVYCFPFIQMSAVLCVHSFQSDLPPSKSLMY